MSLTSLLRTNSEMIKLFRDLPNIKNLIRIEGEGFTDFKELKMKNPVITKNPQLIGHAYDQFLQLYCMRINRIELKVNYSFEEDDEFPELAKYDFNTSLNSYVNSLTDWNHQLSQESIILGKLDQYSRCGIPPIDITTIDMSDIDDLDNLIYTTLDRYNLFKSENKFISNPHFGESISTLIGGADADLIIDDSLIDIKVRSKIQYESYPWKQLIGYYILNLLSPNSSHAINRIAIWNPRYDIYMYIELKELCEHLDLDQFVYDFIETIYCVHKDKTRTPTFLELIKDIESIWENKRISLKHTR